MISKTDAVILVKKMAKHEITVLRAKRVVEAFMVAVDAGRCPEDIGDNIRSADFANLLVLLRELDA
jgi:hypothetical protein